MSSSAVAQAAPPQRAEVLVLGTYHMANPGHDVFNMKADDVLETLLDMNDDQKVAQDVGFYFREARLGEPGDYAGPDLLASWYQRNIRIYNNIAKIIESPNERVLVIYGAGHLGWLRQDIANDPTLRLRKLSEFTASHTN